MPKRWPHAQRPVSITRVPAGFSERQRVRRRLYLAMMGICLLLVVLAWNVVRFWSTAAAVWMSVVAALIPPVAAFLANRQDG